jgi:hypothetical protein
VNIFCEGGWLNVLGFALAGNTLFRIHLFQNNHVPVFTDDLISYVEATFSGYGSSLLLGWGSPFINGSNQAEVDASTVVWTRSGGAVSNSIYGVYVTDGTGNLAYAERFGAPVSMVNPGDTISYIPRATLINQ